MCQLEQNMKLAATFPELVYTKEKVLIKVRNELQRCKAT